ncbi:glycosyl hydrolase family 28-related protein [Alteromonas sp. PRIM-21]|uniref:glycosyl hydrolase family 28-related protein n=1 Tax=Alteromonas sp. PRIM-21 TaxID=1454978 RepID=UPI0022B9607B|nr:glycosyl hydrolase family 28-related protein [Alteromonas sp. PRIM-21]MCZ8530103.1 hypothetical protein [Alteromonas sp. PRIM-21]
MFNQKQTLSHCVSRKLSTFNKKLVQNLLSRSLYHASSRPTLSVLSAIPALLTLNMAQAQVAEVTQWEVMSDTVVEQSDRYVKRGVGYFTENTFTLSESVSQSDTLRLVVTQSSHEVIEPDGYNNFNQPYFNITATQNSHTIYFSPARKAFAYDVKLQQQVQPSNALAFAYDFNIDQVQLENNNWEGWVYPTRNRGEMVFEADGGRDETGAISYTDTSANVNITQNGIRFNNRTNQPNINPWTTLLEGAIGKDINSVSLWVKVEKAQPGNVTVRHNLVPFPVIDDKKGPTINAGIDIGPQYEMIIPASENGNWVQVEFIDSKTGLRSFTIPDTWRHFDGESSIQVYPQFLFDGLEVGDKVTIDSYAINEISLDEACCAPVDDSDTGNSGGGSSGGSDSTPDINEPDYQLGDILNFNYTFDENSLAPNQGSQGWVYSVIDRGALSFADGEGRNGAALVYEDTSENVNPEQNGFYLQQWNNSPFTARFDNHGHILREVSLWVKTDLVSEKDIEIIHYLLPYGLVSGNKRNNYPAAVEAAPRYTGTIPANSRGWVELTLTLTSDSEGDFIIPSTWSGYEGGDFNIYPEFKFAGTEVGDKIYLDDYFVVSEVGEPLPIPTDFTIAYDFEEVTVSQTNGWGFVLADFGSISLEDNGGVNSSSAIGYTDTSVNTDINNQSLLWHKWGNANPWSQAFGGGAVDTEIQSVSLNVKVVKGAGNPSTTPVTVKHHLLPWNVTLSGGKSGKVAAAQAITADYTATVEPEHFGDWVTITFVDANTDELGFSVPESWILTTGKDITDVLPSFYFGGLEEGDKVIIDDYLLVGDNALARSGEIENDVPLPEYGYHDGSGTYTVTPRPDPISFEDSRFYTPPSATGIQRDLLVDYAVNNQDSTDDTQVLQEALDDISNNLGGGKLFIPAGDYYFRSVHLRSNVQIVVDENARFYLAPGGGYNTWMFEMGFGDQGKAENVSMVGLGEGFTIDLSIDRTPEPNERIAVFRMGDIENFRFANFTIEDNKTIFASFLVGVTQRDNDLHWPVNGIIEDITQYNSLFGYGLVQTYAADNILFRNLHSEGGITLRMETDNLSMKDFGKGGIRDIFAENIQGTDCLAPVMFGPHFQENGSVQVNGVVSHGCGFAVRVDEGFVELFSPQGESYTRNQWRDEVNATYGDGCADVTYARGANQWATRITPTKACLDAVHNRTKLKPGWFEESYVYNVTANFDTNAHLKLDNLNFVASCDNICIASPEQWSRRGQIFLGDSVAAIVNEQKEGVDYNFNINIDNPSSNGFPNGHYEKLDSFSMPLSSCRSNYQTALPNCSDLRWY